MIQPQILPLGSTLKMAVECDIGQKTTTKTSTVNKYEYDKSNIGSNIKIKYSKLDYKIADPDFNTSYERKCSEDCSKDNIITTKK